MSSSLETYVNSLKTRINSVEKKLTWVFDELYLRAYANPFAIAVGDVSSGTTRTVTSDTTLSAVSPPTTPSVVQQVGTVTISWGASNSARLIPYEIQFSTDLGFSDVTTKYSSDLQYTWPEGDPDETYYARVRARTLDGGISSWTVPLETSTGKAGWEDLASLAATNPIRVEDDRETSGAGSGEDIDAGTGPADFAEATITTTGGIVTIDAQVQASYMGDLQDSFSIDVYRDSTVVSESGLIEFPSQVTSLVRASFPGIGLPAAPPAGTYTYKVQVDAYDTGGAAATSVQVRVHQVIMALTELRQGVTG